MLGVLSCRGIGDCESIMTLASPFVKGGSRGILLSHRLLIFKNNFLIDQISPNPSLLKRGIKRILSQSHKYLHKFLIGVETKKHRRGVLHKPNIESPML